MTGDRAASARTRARVEDVLLCGLGLIAGPLLWWMGQTWQDLPAASSAQTLEYWIALICGFSGVALSTLWLIFLVAGLGMIVGLKTRNALITYWAEVFTPTFVRRLIISIIGAQVTLASPALAAHTDDQISETDKAHQHQPFMPYVHGPGGAPTESPDVLESPAKKKQTDASPSASPRPTESITATAEGSPPVQTDAAAPPVEPRQQSESIITPTPADPPAQAGDEVPTPRQTSTFEVEQEAASDVPATSQPHQLRERFVPQQPVPSPYIAAPHPSRTTEDPTVVVKFGDCLWDIAHHELGAEATLFQVDQRWRQWWDYNLTTIGEDPHVLTPGTVLQSPPFTT